MATIFDFASQLNSSARPNQFRVHIIFPTALVENGNAVKQQATFLTNVASLPSYNTQDCPVYYRGRLIHEAGEKEYEQWSCTIYNSADFAIRTAIEQWDNAIHDPQVVAGITVPASYKSNILIEQLDRNDNTLRVYKLVGCFPASTGRIELNFQEGSTLENFETTWYYDYFTVGGKELLESAEYTGS